jgi:hypothetical protein
MNLTDVDVSTLWLDAARTKGRITHTQEYAPAGSISSEAYNRGGQLGLLIYSPIEDLLRRDIGTQMISTIVGQLREAGVA